jgi:5'-nucleotidase
VRTVLIAAVVTAAGACSGDSTSSATTVVPTTVAPATTAADTTTTAAPVLTILVSDDDGVHAPGIDALVQALVALPSVDVTVVAPAEDQSGSGGKTTDGPLTATATTTASAYPATAVDGYPADSVNYALDEVLDRPPGLVIAGSNRGQNIGPLVDISGTVGAARAGAQRGIAAIAVSQGLADSIDYTVSVQAAIDWITAHRDNLAGATGGGVFNINAPTCPGNQTRGPIDVPTATDLAGRDFTKVDCASTATDPVDDVDAFLEGYIAESPISAAPAG